METDMKEIRRGRKGSCIKRFICNEDIVIGGFPCHDMGRFIMSIVNGKTCEKSQFWLCVTILIKFYHQTICKHKDIFRLFSRGM